VKALLRTIVIAGWALTLGSCAASVGGLESAPAMPAARAGLRPEYRVFYDALSDYGDWTLVEPYGYVFRPAVSFATWRPYEYGFWVPTDSYGWVWISSEPFGWATYHYGRWFYDEFQGWVWRPGIDWGPAWVTWQMSNQYVGWSPLGSGEGPGVGVPGGAFRFTTVDQMGATDLSSRLETQSDLGVAAAELKPVTNPAVAGGTRIELGPPIARLERTLGHRLPRVRVEDVVLPVGTQGGQKAAHGAATAVPGMNVDETRRAAEQVAREARAMVERGSRPPERLHLVRPIRPGFQEALKPARNPGRPRPSRPDSAATRPDK